jgi:hypothetical protein
LGLNLQRGTVQGNTLVISGNRGQGVLGSASNPAATLLTLNGSTVTNNGASSGGATLPGISWLAPNDLVLSTTTVSNNGGGGLQVNGGNAVANTITLTNASFLNNGSAGAVLPSFGVLLQSGTLNAMGLVATGNRGAGLAVSNQSMGNVLNGGDLSANTAQGLLVTNANTTLSVTGTVVISNNGTTNPPAAGVRVEGATLSMVGMPGAPISVRGNAFYGIHVTGAGGFRGDYLAISGNAQTGVAVTTGTPSFSLSHSDVNTNGRASFGLNDPVSGVAISTQVATFQFVGNSIHDNTFGHQVGIFSSPLGGVSYSLNAGSCGGNNNRITGYAVGMVGLFLRPTSGNFSVDAGNVKWTNAMPTVGVDFQNNGLTLNTMPPCP